MIVAISAFTGNSATSAGGAIYGDDVPSVSDSACRQACPDPARHYCEDPAKLSARLMANDQMEA